MKAERQKEPEQGGGSNRKVGDGEGGSLKARRGPKFPPKDASQSGAWAGGLTAGATPGGDNDLNSSKHLFKHTGVLWVFGLGKDR